MKSWRTKLRGSEFKVMRLNEAVPIADSVFNDPENVATYLRQALPGSLNYRPDVENFIVVYLNVRKLPIGFEVVSNGVLDTLLVDSRSTFRGAIISNAHAIILAHNHPSGDPTPSEQDIRATRDLYRAGLVLKIEVLDHIILGTASPSRIRDYCSLRELGYFCSIS